MVYAPQVGRTYTPDDFSSLSLTSIMQRDMMDPRYSDASTGSTSYDWRQHFVMKYTDKAMEREVCAAMDSYAATPEGRQTLRQAVAMQAFRFQSDDYRNANDSDTPEMRRQQQAEYLRNRDPQGRIILVQDMTDPSAPTTSANLDAKNSANSFDLLNGTLALNQGVLNGAPYLGVDGQKHPTTLQHVLYHELLHAADPLNTSKSLGQLHSYLIDRGFWDEHNEFPVYYATNDLMSKIDPQFVPRALEHGGSVVFDMQDPGATIEEKLKPHPDHGPRVNGPTPADATNAASSPADTITAPAAPSRIAHTGDDSPASLMGLPAPRFDRAPENVERTPG